MPGLEYTAQVTSQSLNDEAKLTISADGVSLATLFGAGWIDFADVVSIQRQGYGLVITTGADRFVFDRLGSRLDAFELDLTRAFNAKVRRALFVDGTPSVVAAGDFAYWESGGTAQGWAAVEVYDDCVLLLPPDDRARRIPFAFMTGFQRDGFTLWFTLDGGDRYSVSRLGHDTDAVESCVKDTLHRYRANAIEAVRTLDGSLNPAQLAAIAGLMPDGVAVPLSKLAAIAGSAVAAVEARIAQSRAADTYTALKQMCGDISVGMKTNLAGEQAENVLWFIAPSTVKPVAAVEFAVDEDTAAATYIYTITGEVPDFIRQLNRAIEAIDFHREVIALPDADLARAENSHYRMAVTRTAALRFIRAALAGRVIHSTLQTWTAEVREQLGYV